MKKNERYIIDPLYGIIYLPKFVWDILVVPELQRLREVRLCNINSLCLTGGANINRYEHSIGTCYLAMECLNFWPSFNSINAKDRKYIILSALLHDIVSAPFGHSFQYIESKSGFDHEKAFKYVAMGGIGDSYPYKYKLEPIYFGMPSSLYSKLTETDIEKISEIISGNGDFGPLINSTIDLDNIDNVFRLAYHIGLVEKSEIPLKLARSLYTQNNKLILRDESLHLAAKWYKIREKLYSVLLLNIDEFSAKGMLTEAIEFAKLKEDRALKWNYVDYQLLEKLSEMPAACLSIEIPLFDLDKSFEAQFDNYVLADSLLSRLELTKNAKIKRYNDFWVLRDERKKYLIRKINGHLGVSEESLVNVEITEIVSRLMKGDLYGYIGIFSTGKTDKIGLFTDFTSRLQLEVRLNKIIRSKFKDANRLKSAKILIHTILDQNKTKRQILIETDKSELVSIGESSNQLLIGVFFKNVNLNMNAINKIPSTILNDLRQETFIYLSKVLDDKDLVEVNPNAEINEWTGK